MARRGPEILERSLHAATEPAAKNDDLVDELVAAGASDPIVVHAKMLRSNS